MNKKDFDEWCQRELTGIKKELMKKYPRCRPTLDLDLSDFYEHVILKQLDDLNDPKGYLFTFIYNRHYRFFSNTPQATQRLGHLVYQKGLKIKLVEEYTDLVEDEEDEEDERIAKITEIIHHLPLYDQKLYQYYYVQGKTIREIALQLDLSPGGIHKQIKKITKKVKKAIMLEALILGLCIILIYSTAQPVLWIRYSLVDLFINRDSCPPRQLWLSRLLECLSCSSFWIGIGVWFLIPYVPLFFTVRDLLICDSHKYRNH